MRESMKGAGYYFDTPTIGRVPTVRYYSDMCPPVFADGLLRNVDVRKHYFHGGNSLTGGCFMDIFRMLAPLGKTQLVTIITLLVMKRLVGSKKQKGGEIPLLSLSKNVLLIIAALLLLHYYSRQRGHKKRGGAACTCQTSVGSCHCIQDGSSCTCYQTGGKKCKCGCTKGGLLSNISRAAAPMGSTPFTATALILLLRRILKRDNDNYQRGGGGAQLVMTLQRLLAPMGINTFLTGLGLAVLSKVFDRRQRGGYGEKVITYSDDLKQFGCKIPEWGYNLVLPHGEKCV